MHAGFMHTPDGCRAQWCVKSFGVDLIQDRSLLALSGTAEIGREKDVRACQGVQLLAAVIDVVCCV